MHPTADTGRKGQTFRFLKRALTIRLERCQVAVMSRPLRIEVAGGCYQVTSRGNERREIYREPADRLRFLQVVAACWERFQVRLWGYILMDNHYHLGVETPEVNLSRVMHSSLGKNSNRGWRATLGSRWLSVR
jgi:REP element-mobilizing transposase RayT